MRLQADDDAAATPSAAEAEPFVLVARLAHIKGMLGVLQAVKQTKKQARAQRRRWRERLGGACARVC
jgi:hypothetical protein